MRHMGLIAAAVFLSAPAIAQQKPVQTQGGAEYFCLYDNITRDDALQVLDAIVFGKTADTSEAKAILDAAQAECAKHKWSDDQALVAEDIAIGAFLTELAAAGLAQRGFTAYDKLHGVVDDLSDGDYGLIVEGKYDDASDMRKRVETQLRAAGVPDKDDALETAFMFIEAAVLTDDAIAEFKHVKTNGAAAKN